MSEHVVFTAGQPLTAGDLQNLGGPITMFTPTLTATTTAPTLGTGGEAKGWWCRQSGIVTGGVIFRFGTSGVNAGSGTYEVLLPVNILDIGFFEQNLGAGMAFDSSAVDDRVCEAYWVPSATDRIRIRAEGAGTFTNTTPWTWAASDHFAVSFEYPGNF